MGINSKIASSVSEAISQKNAKDKLEGVRQNADFSVVEKDVLSPIERIDYALNKLQNEIVTIKRAKLASGIALTMSLIAAALVIYLAATMGQAGKIMRPIWIIGLSAVVFFGMLSVFSLDRSNEEGIILFWTAYANNLLDEYDEELDYCVKNRVCYWTQKTLKLI